MKKLPPRCARCRSAELEPTTGSWSGRNYLQCRKCGFLNNPPRKPRKKP
jgi:predicted Zn-ribbon and HTH transcriptional regulator